MDPLVIIITAVLGTLLFVQVNTHWRSGMYFILGVGFVQDLVRKLVPGEPVAISAVVGIVMLLVWGIGLGQFRGQSNAMNLRLNYPAVVRAFVFFGGMVVFQALITLVNFGSIPLAGIGLIAYLSPLPAMWIGWWFCRTEKDYRDMALMYVAFGLLVASSVYVSWVGADWTVLKHVGEALVFYGEDGIIAMHTGFMRAPEVTAWHMGAAACFVILLATRQPSVLRIAAFLLTMAVLVPAIYLTGRRKALAMIGLFVGILIILLQFSRHRDARKTSFALLGLALGVIGMLAYMGEDLSDASAFRSYADRGSSTFDGAWERFYNLGLGSVGWAVDQVGILGLGAGAVSQGSQHFGVEESMTGAAEGGLGKIIVELGIPGLVIVTWVLWIIAKTIRRLLAQTDRTSGQASTTAMALVAFLVANIILFITASQIFGDPFVLILLGISFGALLATPRLGQGQQKSQVSDVRTGAVAGMSLENRVRGF